MAARLVVRADDKSLFGHAGVVLLRKVADRVGLTAALTAALPRGVGPGWRDRGMALVQLACAIVIGARTVLEAEQLQHHWKGLFGRPLSDSTLRRTLEAVDPAVAARLERVRAVIRRVVWTLLALRPGGFPWFRVCGRVLTGWYVLDLDATIVPCTSRKDGAAGTFKGGFGHHPLGAVSFCGRPVFGVPSQVLGDGGGGVVAGGRARFELASGRRCCHDADLFGAFGAAGQAP
ncbi:hypothetical protein N566_06825 [Streptomycetaceae bacterium MP113-05]|nr:hypothetical protein N566_06825 [Streptomycetaceae bacterium MP113-05]